MALGLYDKNVILKKQPKKIYMPKMNEKERSKLYAGWKRAVDFALTY
jgi:glycerol kinase